MNRDAHGRAWSVDRAARTAKAHGVQTWVNREIQAATLDMALNVGYMDGMVLDQLIVKVNEDGWLVLVKAHRNGRRRVAFVGGASFSEALELAADFAEKGILTWQKDSWPPKVLSRFRPKHNR